MYRARQAFAIYRLYIVVVNKTTTAGRLQYSKVKLDATVYATVLLRVRKLSCEMNMDMNEKGLRECDYKRKGIT